jgi:Rod binding domain-containing protein
MSDFLTAPIDTRTIMNTMMPSGSATPTGRGLAATDFDVTSGEKPDVDQVLSAFQEVFFNEMMKAMRASVPESGFLDEESSMGRDTFEAMLDQEYARAMGERIGGLGLTEALKWQLGLASPSTTTDTPAAIPIEKGDGR